MKSEPAHFPAGGKALFHNSPVTVGLLCSRLEEAQRKSFSLVVLSEQFSLLGCGGLFLFLCFVLQGVISLYQLLFVILNPRLSYFLL